MFSTRGDQLPERLSRPLRAVKARGLDQERSHRGASGKGIDQVQDMLSRPVPRELEGQPAVRRRTDFPRFIVEPHLRGAEPSARRQRNSELVLAGPKSKRQLQAVIDTGYNGSLTLSPADIKLLKLRFAGYRIAKLADGSAIRLDVFTANITWHGQPKKILVSETAGPTLIDTSLLEANRLTSMSSKEARFPSSNYRRSLFSRDASN